MNNTKIIVMILICIIGLLVLLFINKIYESFQNNETIDIVIPFHPKDSKILPYCIKGLNNVKNKGKIYLISVTNPKIDNTIFIDESIFPFNKESIIQYIGEENKSRAGWYLQQLLKIYCFNVIPNLSENYLVVDSETVFLNEVQFIEDNKLLFATGNENHLPYFKHMECILPSLKKQIDKSGVCHHMIFSQYYLKNMFNNFNNNVLDSFMKCVDKENSSLSGMSEYEIFFNYMQQYHPNNMKIRELRWANINEISNYNKYTSLDDVLDDNKNKYDFITIHSYMNVNFS